MKVVIWLLLVGNLITGCSANTELVTPAASATPEQIQEELSEEEAAIAAWLRAEAIELKTDDPTASDEDLEALREIVGDSRVVLLGEQTHGTHEFYTMRHRVIRFLVEELGFDALVVEAPWAPGEEVNDYVHGAELDGWTTLENMQYWTFATTEALDMLEWMRDYNAKVAESEQIAFYGMDMQAPIFSIEKVIAKLQALDAEAVAQAEEAYACYGDYFTFIALESGEQADCVEQARLVVELIASLQSQYAGRLNTMEYETLLQDAWVVVQGMDFLPNSRGADRDRAMAENVAWVLENSGPNAKVIVWAHNAHIDQQQGRLGGYLEESYGDDVIGIGMAMYRGSFMAIPADAPGEVVAIEAAQPPTGNYEYYLNLAGHPYFLLDLREEDTSADGAEWLSGSRGFRLSGSVTGRSDLPDRNYTITSLLEDFDALIFIRDTTPSMPLILASE